MVILKSMAFQMLNNNRVSSIAINRANELGVTDEQERALTLSLAEVSFVKNKIIIPFCESDQ
jgi:hypothetical protein